MTFRAVKVALVTALSFAAAPELMRALDERALQDIPARFTPRMALAQTEHGDAVISVREFITETAIDKQARKLYDKALTAERKGDFGRALKLMEATVEVASDFFQARAALAVGYLKTGRLDEAERYVQSSLRLNPNYLPAHEIHGLVLYFQGRFPEAADALAGLVKKTPCRKTVHYYLGRALENVGDLEKARYHLDAAEALASKASRALPAEASPDWLSGSFRAHRFP